MALELNEQHIEILTEARENLRDRWEGDKTAGSEYICVQLLQILGRRNGIDDIKNPQDLPMNARLLFFELEGAISQALDHKSSVGIYINRLKMNIAGERTPYSYLAPLARLAWLDRMLETKVIA